MTVKELKEILANYDDELIISVKDDCGDYSIADDCYEDTEQYWDSLADYRAHKSAKTRKVLRIF